MLIYRRGVLKINLFFFALTCIHVKTEIKLSDHAVFITLVA